MNVFTDICRGLREGKKLFLATIIRSSGSVPAPLSSRMLVSDEGDLVATGTVGGGCLDGAVLQAVRKGLPAGVPAIEEFNLNDEFGDTEFTCGGTVEIMVEPLSAEHIPLFERLTEELSEGRDCVLRSVIRKDGPAVKSLHAADGRSLLPGPGEPGRAGEREIVEQIEADPSLVVFGGGHVGRAVARLAAHAGFAVTVVDDRPEFADPGRFPGARAVVCDYFDRAIGKVGLSERSFVVIATRGHRHDEAILEECVGKDLRYLGMIGSRRKVKMAFDRLRQRGVSEEALSGVHAPIGLPIGAKTAGEIGVSIVAELIAVRRGRQAAGA